MGDNEITAIVGWPTEPEMVKYRKVAAAATAMERERLVNKIRAIAGAWAEARIPLEACIGAMLADDA